MGLHPSGHGIELMKEAEQTAAGLERDATRQLTATELKTLHRLLKKIYQ